MKKSYKFRIYPSKTISEDLTRWLNLCRNLYNCALEQRITAYRQSRKSISYFSQKKELPAIKTELPEYKEVFSQTIQATLNVLDIAYQNFFRRVKNGDPEAGFPRFKNADRFHSLMFPQYPKGCKLKDNKLYISKIGAIKVKLSRPIEGVIKTATIKRTTTGKWFVIFSCDGVPERPLPKTRLPVGIDMGLTHFLTTSDGTHIPNPRYFKKSQTLLARRQQILAKRKKGTQRRKRAKLLVAKAYEKISNQRTDFHFKTANALVETYDFIAYEKLDINGMTSKNHSLNRSKNDAAWGSFLNILNWKAEEAAKTVVAVDPKGTSQRCYACNELVLKDLSVRVHKCPHCGLVLDRDVNAALNILGLGMSLAQSLLYTSAEVA